MHLCVNIVVVKHFIRCILILWILGVEYHFQNIYQNMHWIIFVTVSTLLSPQECRKIMSFDIISTVNPIGSMKTRGKSSCTQCMKERIEIIDNLRHMYSRIINTCSEVYRACRHIPRFHRFIQHWWSSDGWKIREFRIFQIDQKEKLFPADRTNFEKGEDHNPWEGIFRVK